MPRLSIDITPEQHQRLKAIAALSGQSIKDYVLGRSLAMIPETAELSEEEALQRLEDFLAPRLEAARKGELSSRTVRDIMEDVRRDYQNDAL